jgi:hypothetical protein
MRKLSALVALSLALTSVPAQAWNDRGHMTVAGVAWAHMTPRARARATALLRLNPDYAGWVANAAPADRDQLGFMISATWPDKLRGRVCRTPPRPNCIRDDGYTPADAEADQNIGYRDRRLRPYWHFINLPYATPANLGRPPFRVNAETQINAFIRSLSDSALADDAKSFNLTWLLHMVGDVHQPLHATARFTTGFRNGDGGGNRTIVCLPQPAPCVTSGRDVIKLHNIWDRSFGTDNRPASALEAARAMVAELRNANSDVSRAVAAVDLNAPTRTWLNESLRLSIDFAYVSPVRAESGPITLTSTYMSNATREGTRRVAIAGRRLAELLNRALG